ncbi:MAG: hypothetical protein ABIF85_00475 [Nanoarchaeota archaeon]|nr:hypothetical protein [Nanoarchaeota archaeon]MBU4300657.1 hypothetical protein [Nanoarchaeota archaeon]MBU4452481.1 hypothetical protein [Nanoarchaeota archaeon]MCG2723442.1 hypothetical protein [archaeon]
MVDSTNPTKTDSIFAEKKDYMPFDVLNFCQYCNMSKSKENNMIDASGMRSAALDSAKSYTNPAAKDKMILDLAGAKSSVCELEAKDPETYKKVLGVFEKTIDAVNYFTDFCTKECANRST